MKLEESGPANSVTGRIESITYGGSTVDYLVGTPLGELEVCRFASQAQYRVGDTATIFWSPSSGALLDSEQS
jgi:hypothetical protein